jgi:hypothetical protein
MVLALGVRYIVMNNTTFMKYLMSACLFCTILYRILPLPRLQVYSQSRASVTGAYGGNQ